MCRDPPDIYVPKTPNDYGSWFRLEKYTFLRQKSFYKYAGLGNCFSEMRLFPLQVIFSAVRGDRESLGTRPFQPSNCNHVLWFWSSDRVDSTSAAFGSVNRPPAGLSSGLGLGLVGGWVSSGRSRVYLLVLWMNE